MALSRDMGALASGMSKGIQLGQEYNANEQDQALKQKQLGEIERKEKMRTRMSAISPDQYQRTTAGGQQYFDQGGFDTERAKAYTEFGESEQAGKLLGDVDKWNKTEKGAHAARIYGAKQSGNVDALLKETQTMLERFPNGNFARAEDMKYDPKTGTITGIARDMKTGQPVGTKPFSINVDRLYKTAMFESNPEKAEELEWRERMQMEELRQRALDRQATRGANDKWKLKQLQGAKGARGNAIELLENSEGVFTKDEKGNRRRLTAEERMAAGAAAETQYGPNEALAREALGRKQYENSASPESAIQAESSILQQARMKDAAEIIRRDAPGGVLSFTYAGELLRHGATPEMLLAAGFHPDAIPTGAGALQR